jgi:hypothetical protein
VAERRARQRRELIQSVKQETVGYSSWQHPTIPAEVKAEALQEIERKLSALPLDELSRHEVVQIAEGIRDRLFRPVLEAQGVARQRARAQEDARRRAMVEDDAARQRAQAEEEAHRRAQGEEEAARRREEERPVSEWRPSGDSSSTGCPSRLAKTLTETNHPRSSSLRSDISQEQSALSGLVLFLVLLVSDVVLAVFAVFVELVGLFIVFVLVIFAELLLEDVVDNLVGVCAARRTQEPGATNSTPRRAPPPFTASDAPSLFRPCAIERHGARRPGSR